jgi:predicted porin
MPAAAFAQSSVTISGKLIWSFGNYKVASQVAGTGRSSENQLRDESSRIIFQIREDLGGGLAAIGKFDFRAAPDSGAGPANTGESYLGLTSPTWGTIAAGRFDIHYGNSASFTGVHSGLQSNPTAIMDRAGAGALFVVNQTRTPDTIRYGSPKWGNMFEVAVYHSTSGSVAATTEADLRSFNRKGSLWSVNPKVWGSNWEVGYSYLTAKPDVGGAAATTTKNRGDSLYGWYKWGGLRVGLAWNKSKINSTTAAGVTSEATNRTAWGLPISYNWGAHTVYLDLNRARADKAAVFAGMDTKANFVGLTYAYDLSKRTSLALSYQRINNGTAAAYNFFSGNAGLVAGEDPRSYYVTMRHNF